MPCTIGRRPLMRYSRSSLSAVIMILLCFVSAAGSTAAHDAATTSTADGDVRVLMFNLNPSRTYTVLKNANLFTTSNSSPEGASGFTDAAVGGDRYEIIETGSSPTAPTAPSGVAAQGNDAGCASITWNTNPESDIHSYRVYYGTSSVQGGDAASYGDSVLAGDVTSISICGLPDATYYFALRACNTAGLLSALSPEVSASVSNGNAQPPLPPLVVTASPGGPGCVDVAWVPNGAPDVVGYVVDYGPASVAGGEAPEYQSSVEVGSVSSCQLSDLPAGTCYVAVRAKNNLGLLSTYSAERSAEVLETAVFVTAFVAEAVPAGVRLIWEVRADEDIRGYDIYRSADGGGEAEKINGSFLIPAASSSYTDTGTDPGSVYYYTLFVIGEAGGEYRSSSVRFRTEALALDLEQNFPNPFNPATTIVYSLPASARVTLSVYDVTGALVKTLVDKTLPAGTHAVRWDGTNSGGGVAGSGQYFYRLTAGNKTKTRKMLLLK